MDLNSRLNLPEISYKKAIVIGIVIILCLIVGIAIYISSRTPEEPIVNEDKNFELVVDSEPIITEPLDTEQEDIVGRVIATITKIRDFGTRIEYDIEVGLVENKTPSIVKANSKTVFYDMSTKKVINPSSIVEGDVIQVFATGKYTIGNLSAMLICKGDDTSYNYGEVIAINSNDSKSFIWTLDGIADKLYVGAECVFRNGYTGDIVQNHNTMQLNDKILYKGSMEQTDIGNVYYCEEIITFGNNT